MQKIILMVVGLAVLIGVGYFLFFKEVAPPPQEVGGVMTTFEKPKKSAHYETNTPEHGSVLAAVPINVVIDFNFDLAFPSEIKILKDGKDYGSGGTVIDDNKLAMRRPMDQSAPDGLYRVEYNACWPDSSCHTGHFQFAIDQGKISSYLDLRDEKEVTVKLSEIKFQPANILISRGTKVNWINDDKAPHYVNTDSHPAHTYFTKQNSRELKKGDSFSLVFDEEGIYPYHCSAHAKTMHGSIVVGDGEVMPKTAISFESKFAGQVIAGKSAPLLDFNKSDYDQALRSDKLVVLYFYATWCPICKYETISALYPAFNELKSDKIVGFRVNYNDSDTDQDETNLAREFGVAYQHTKVFVKNGQRILKSPESWNKERYLSEINKFSAKQ
ncbi:MAG: cupredoxin domain-containing protein [Candidatus Harrisonbacteria bacterium]|nr:cupredoxin domain-containing protein [Candidatus Harrisonbacteria bacterium]